MEAVLIQAAEAATLASPRTHNAVAYFPSEDIQLTHSERMRLYTTGWFDLACLGLLLLLLCVALFA